MTPSFAASAARRADVPNRRPAGSGGPLRPRTLRSLDHNLTTNGAHNAGRRWTSPAENLHVLGRFGRSRTTMDGPGKDSESAGCRFESYSAHQKNAVTTPRSNPAPAGLRRLRRFGPGLVTITGPSSPPPPVRDHGLYARLDVGARFGFRRWPLRETPQTPSWFAVSYDAAAEELLGLVRRRPPTSSRHACRSALGCCPAWRPALRRGPHQRRRGHGRQATAQLCAVLRPGLSSATSIRRKRRGSKPRVLSSGAVPCACRWRTFGRCPTSPRDGRRGRGLTIPRPAVTASASGS